MVPALLLVAMPVSFYIHALSIGYNNNRNMRLILGASAINGIVLVYNELIGAGIDSELIAFLMLSFLLVIGPVLGMLSIRENMSNFNR